MKHVLITLLAFITLNTSAQQQEKVDKPRFTAEQIATIKTKRMTLALDLNASQQQKIQELNLENTKHRKQKRGDIQEKRKSRAKLSPDKRFALVNETLDKAIAHKSAMKTILNKEQFEKWEKGNRQKRIARNRVKRQKMMKRRRMRQTIKRH